MSPAKQVVGCTKHRHHAGVGQHHSRDKIFCDIFFYGPLEQRLVSFRKQHAADQNVQDFLDSIQQEIDVYRKCSSSFGHTFYVMKKA